MHRSGVELIKIETTLRWKGHLTKFELVSPTLGRIKDLVDSALLPESYMEAWSLRHLDGTLWPFSQVRGVIAEAMPLFEALATRETPILLECDEQHVAYYRKTMAREEGWTVTVLAKGLDVIVDDVTYPNEHIVMLKKVDQWLPS